MSTGIKFHTDGAAERNAREPIAVLIRGTVRVPTALNINVIIFYVANSIEVIYSIKM